MTSPNLPLSLSTIASNLMDAGNPIITGTPTNATRAVPYSFTYTVSGGTPPRIGQLIGELPPGLSFDPLTFTISGTPL